MDFASYGYQIFSSEVDDHGIDFIASKADGEFLEIQVKSLSFPKSTYTFLKEKHFNLHKKRFYIYLMLFADFIFMDIFKYYGRKSNRKNI
ncbi:hypothetical protein BHT94_19830 [Bacillus licheniformis]|nr:hypothetical protein BHT94_19830 [Bacillus licheniformis]RJS57269.1 hypothetical protein CJ481_15970 [Bacillus subtilis]